MKIITLNELSKAIARRLDIDNEKAREYANTVIDFFGFHDRIIDNVLTPQERKLFYELQERGILTSEREATTLYNGNQWRTHYWRLEKDAIVKYSNGKKKKSATQGNDAQNTGYEDVYSTITKDMWTTRKIIRG